MIWTVPRKWDGETVCILAGGPSLKGFDASILRRPGWKVIAVNDSWRLASWCDCLYFSDANFYVTSLQRDPWALDMSINFGQLLYRRLLVNGSSLGEFADHPQVKQLRMTGQSGLETDHGGLRHGNNSAYAAMNLAYHFGASRIVLLGLDMRVSGNRTHWHDEVRPDGFADILRQSMLPMFPSLVEPLQSAGIEVLNATPGSALECWPNVPLKEILEGVYDHDRHTDQSRHSDQLSSIG